MKAGATTERSVTLSSLQDWLHVVEQIGELKRITAEVDPDLELSTINYLSSKRPNAPALMFENIKGHSGCCLLMNLFGLSLNRVAVSLREEPGKSGVDLVSLLRWKMKNRIPPRFVEASSAPVNQNVETGDRVDLTKFPAPKMYPRDGGRYIGTACSVITVDPANGRMNLGTYRQMLQGPRQVGFYVSPGKDANLDRENWWAKGKGAPVAACYGLDPLQFMVSATTFPKDVSEYEYYGGMNGAPIEVFKSDITGLTLPAHAELIVEGWSYPGKDAPEGPFGEFTGYYGRPGGPTPYIEVETIRHRDHAVMTSEMEIGNTMMQGLTRAAKVWDDLDALGVPGVRGVWSPPETTGWGITVVSIEQRYAGHAAQVGALAAQCMGGAYFTKYIIVVDDDIDPTNLAEVMWAVVTRSRPTQSIDILRETWSTFLDPSQNPPELRPSGSKCVINACKEFRYLKVFSPRTLLQKDVYESVCARWRELGFESEPANVISFETFKEEVAG